MSNEETITIPLKRYYELLDTQKYADALDSAGVDNWEGYSHALSIMEEDE